MAKEKYFLIDSNSDVLSKKLVSPDYVTRAYNVVSSVRNSRQVLGISRGDAIISKNKLKLEVENVLYDFNSEPDLISIISLDSYSDHSKLGTIIGGLVYKEDGIYYRKKYGYNSGMYTHDLKCKLIKVATSQRTNTFDRLIPKQYVVLEFSGNQASAKKYSSILEEKIGRYDRVIKSDVFCVLGGNIKQTIKPMPTQ